MGSKVRGEVGHIVETVAQEEKFEGRRRLGRLRPIKHERGAYQTLKQRARFVMVV